MQRSLNSFKRPYKDCQICLTFKDCKSSKSFFSIGKQQRTDILNNTALATEFHKPITTNIEEKENMLYMSLICSYTIYLL